MQTNWTQIETSVETQWQVLLVKPGLTNVFGVYPSEEQANTIAEQHKVTGYWDQVQVNPV